MAKDGTMRGGARIGAGKKKKSLEEKILEGKAPLMESSENVDFEIPEPKNYLSAEQKSEAGTHALEVYFATYNWLKKHGCAELIAPQLVESYSQVVGRHIQCEKILNQKGLLGAHPTTGEPMISPFVKMSLDYLKSANQLWYQIFQVAKENSIGVGDNASDTMEKLLAGVKK